MSEEPQEPKLPEPSDEPAAGSGFSTEPSQSPEPPGETAPETRQPESRDFILGNDQPPASREGEPGRGSPETLIKRLTGTLRRVTGPLRPPSNTLPPLENRRLPEIGEPPSQEPEAEIDPMSGKTTTLPELNESSAGKEERDIIQPEPKGKRRRGRKDTSGLETGRLLQRLTGTLRKVTQPLRPPTEEARQEVQARHEIQPETKTGEQPGQPGPESEQPRRMEMEEEAPAIQLPGPAIQPVEIVAEEEPENLPAAAPQESAPEVLSGEAPAPTPKRQRQEGPDYVSEIRHSLTSEESERPKRRTGGMLQRITGTLRRVTGKLRSTDSLPPEESKPAPETAPEAPQPEIADDFLTDRLGGAAIGGPAAGAPTAAEEPAPILLPENWGELPDSGIEAGELLEMEEGQLTSAESQPEPLLGDDEPITLLESGAIAALGESEEAEKEESDWWAEMRKEAAQTAAPSPEQPEAPGPIESESKPEQAEEERPSRRGASGALHSFITGILGRPGEKSGQPEETEIPDTLVTDRLERSLGTEAETAPGPQEEEWIPGEEASFPGETGEQPGFEHPAEPGQPTTQEEVLFGSSEEEAALIDGLEISFSHIEGIDEETEGFQLNPDDENLLWGEPSSGAQSEGEFPAAPTAEDIWGQEDPGGFGYGSDLRREIWGEEIEPEVPPERTPSSTLGQPPESENIFDQADYLAGEELPLEGEEEAQGEMLGKVLDGSTGEDEEITNQDLRSIALEDYEDEAFDYSTYKPKIDWGDEEEATPEPAAEAVPEPAAAEPEIEVSPEPPFTGDWRTWLATRTTPHKLLLAEGALVVLAMLVAVPFFVFMIFRGPAKTSGQLAVSGLPAGLPRPTGLTLPGGWYFELETSTITNGKWQPITSEWLMGTELRRVVALPWNQQTEAVIKTFKAGDPVELYLSNNDTLKYRVSSIERVPVSDSGIYSDNRPSLVIILYKEKDSTRWVVVCKP